MQEYQQDENKENDFVISEGFLYTLRPPGKTAYPRLVLPPSTRFRVIRRAHQEAGHQGMRKTIRPLQEHYKWPGQRRDVVDTVASAHVVKCRRERTTSYLYASSKWRCGTPLAGARFSHKIFCWCTFYKMSLDKCDNATLWHCSSPGIIKTWGFCHYGSSSMS